MELPEDVLTLVRAYSRPLMQYIHEYRAACRDLTGILPIPVFLLEHIKEKLCTREAKPVMDAFRLYVDAALLAFHKDEALAKLPHSTTQEIIAWQECVRSANHLGMQREKLWTDLIEVVYR